MRMMWSFCAVDRCAARERIPHAVSGDALISVEVQR
jgi:hypothetical protein